MELITRYFPKLTPEQQDKFEKLLPVYQEWNAKINVVSRKDIEQLYLHHVLHSLAIARFINFKPGARIIDIGTGGGFPGIPLAILFPDVHFTLIDSIRKKITVVEAVAEACNITNITPIAGRAEELPKRQYDFVVSRAVAALDKLIYWGRPLLKTKHQHGMPNGFVLLKGGDLREEINALPRREYLELIPIQKYFNEPYFETKLVMYVQG